MRDRRLLFTVLATSCLAPLTATPLPVGGVVTGGQATIGTPASGNLAIKQGSDRAVIDWRGFDIGSGESVTIAQPTSSSVILNRIGNGPASQINGRLSANGRVVIANPNGVIFGQGSQVNVASLIATSSHVDSSDFMKGWISGSPGNPNGKVENDGSITAEQGGLVALVAPEVTNSGTITAKAGHVQLAAGDSVAYDLYGDSLLSVAASASQQKALVTQNGKIASGTVVLSAAQASNLVNSAVNMNGVVEATSLSGAGGTVKLTGDHIMISKTAQIHADGTTGGVVHIGGSYQGSGSLPWAKTVTVANGAAITANAIRTNGKGGEAVLWSSQKTQFDGHIEAKGKGTGDGGRVETSSKQNLDVGSDATVNASSDLGVAGSWLLDPGNISLIHAANGASDSNDSVSGGTYTPTAGNDATISDFTVNAALNGGTSVILLTSGTDTNITNTGSPVINFTGAGTESLTLEATGSIQLNNTTIESTGSGKLNTVLWSDSDANGIGTLVLNAGSILTNGGNVAIGGGLDNGANGGIASDGIPDGYSPGSGANANGITLKGGEMITTGAGNITMRGKGYGNGASANGVWLTNGAQLSTTSGNVTLTGSGAAGTNFDFGIYLNLANTQITSQTGAIKLTGTGGGTGTNGYGIDLATGAIISSTGTGSTASTITLKGTSSSSGTTSASGIFITSNGAAGTQVKSVDGAISLTGVGRGSTTNSKGVDIENLAVISATGTGGITLNGMGSISGTSTDGGIYLSDAGVTTTSGDISITGTGGGSGAASLNDGVSFCLASSVNTTSGNIKITGIAGAGTGSVGILSDNTLDTLGSASMTGNITLTSDTDYFDVGGSITSAGAIYLVPLTASTSIGLGDGAPGTLFLSGAELDEFHAGVGTGAQLTIGRTNYDGSGDIHFASYSNWNTNIYVSTNTGHIYFDGAQNLNSNNLTLSTNADLTVSADLNNVGGFSLGSTTNGVSIGIAGGAGTVNLSSAEMDHIHANFMQLGDLYSDNNLTIGAYANWPSYVQFYASSNASINVVGNLSEANPNAMIFNGPTNLGANIDLSAGSGGAVTFNNNVTLNGNSAVSTSGTNTIAFGGTIDGAYNLALSNTGNGNITFAGAVGASTPVGAFSITSASAVSLPSITATSITAETTGAGSNLTLGAGKILTASGAGTAITLDSDHGSVVNQAGASSLVTPAGRWLVYTSAPDNGANGDSYNSLASAFHRFSCAYGGTCPALGMGNGLLYRNTPILTITPATQMVSVGSPATLVGYSYGASGYIGSDGSSDNLTGSLTGTTGYVTSNAIGTYNLNYASGSLMSAMGYGFAYANNANAINVVAASVPSVPPITPPTMPVTPPVSPPIAPPVAPITPPTNDMPPSDDALSVRSSLPSTVLTASSLTTLATTSQQSLGSAPTPETLQSNNTTNGVSPDFRMLGASTNHLSNGLYTYDAALAKQLGLILVDGEYSPKL